MSKPYDDPSILVDASDAIAESAEKEAEAQLKIIRVLRKCKGADSRERVLKAVFHILEADALVPGVIASISKGLKT